MLTSVAATVAVMALNLPFSVAQAHDEVDTGTVQQPREIVVAMTDALRFDPAEITVVAGEVVRFVLSNPTAASHDFLIGDLATQEAHGVEMAAGMMHMHGACPDLKDHHTDETMPHDDGMVMGNVTASPSLEQAGSPMAEAEPTMGHMGGSMDHSDEAADDTQGGLCEGGLPGPVTIAPGETLSVLARFDEPGETLIGCHQPGHWQAGMSGLITIIDA